MPATHTNTNTENLLVVGLNWNIVGILVAVIQSLPSSAPLRLIYTAVCSTAAGWKLFSTPHITCDVPLRSLFSTSTFCRWTFEKVSPADKQSDPFLEVLTQLAFVTNKTLRKFVGFDTMLKALIKSISCLSKNINEYEYDSCYICGCLRSLFQVI